MRWVGSSSSRFVGCRSGNLGNGKTRRDAISIAIDENENGLAVNSLQLELSIMTILDDDN